jgi:enoyl-CoA hydratase
MALAATALHEPRGHAMVDGLRSPLPLSDEPGGRTFCWQHLRIQISGSIVLVVLSNPPANALCYEMFDAVRQTLDFLEADAVHAVIVSGEGENFSVGADLRGILGVTREHVRASQRLLDRIEAFPKPMIAAINGHCLGGGLELALACHLRIASSRAKLGLPEVSLGLLPGLGGTHRLPRLVGRARAHEMILIGRPMRAEEAAAIGLVNAVVPAGDVLPTAERLARRIAAKSPAAVRAIMRCLNADFCSAGERAERVEMECFEQLTRTPGVRHTLHAIERDLGQRRENDV